jgi:glycosyltransferase involved in cell wall biosynthesis
MTSLDIILPAYNPLPGWEETVIGRFQSLEKALPTFKITLFIVNDGSRTLDVTTSTMILRKAIPDIQWISYKVNQGKGYALREGVKKSTGDYILYTDIDWPYTEDSMITVIDMLAKKSDAVIGIRDEGYYTHLPLSRRRISRLLRKINANFLRLKVDDTQAGLKGFARKVKPIFLSTTINRYLFDLEFIYLLSSGKNDLNVTGIPITLRPGITFSQMNRKILFQEARNFLKIWWTT